MHHRFGSRVVGDSFLNTNLTTQTLVQTYIFISSVNIFWDLPKAGGFSSVFLPYKIW
jgi:hypothetical protein